MTGVRLSDAPRAVAPPVTSVPVARLVLVLGLGGLAALLWSLRPPPQHPRPEAVFDLETALPDARVTLRPPGQPERPCPWNAAEHRHVCAPDEWGFVGPYAGYAGGQALRCVWVHPHAGGATTILRWPDVPIGSRVQGKLGLLNDVGPGAEVRLTVYAGEDRIATLATSESRELAKLDNDIAAGPARADLRVEVTATDHAWRLACAQVRLLGTRPEPKTPPTEPRTRGALRPDAPPPLPTAAPDEPPAREPPTEGRRGDSPRDRRRLRGQEGAQ